MRRPYRGVPEPRRISALRRRPTPPSFADCDITAQFRVAVLVLRSGVDGGGAPGRVAIIFTPGAMAGYFDELGPLVPDMMIGITDISKVAPDVLAKIEDVWKRYGYEMVGPPLK